VKVIWRIIGISKVNCKCRQWFSWRKSRFFWNHSFFYK
jgi:hypothetical protein